MLRVRKLRALAQGAGLILFGLVVAGVSLVAWSHWQHHFWTALRGPTEITLAEFATVDRPTQLPSTWIKVKFEKAYDTGIQRKEIKPESTLIVEKYLLVQVGDRWMIAVVPARFCSDTLTGQPKHAESPASAEMFAAIRKDFANVHQGRLLPFEFYAETNYGQTWTYFGVVMAMFGATGGLFSCLGTASMYQALFGPAPVTEDEFEKRATVQVDAAIARIFQSAGAEKPH